MRSHTPWTLLLLHTGTKHQLKRRKYKNAYFKTSYKDICDIVTDSEGNES